MFYIVALLTIACFISLKFSRHPNRCAKLIKMFYFGAFTWACLVIDISPIFNALKHYVAQLTLKLHVESWLRLGYEQRLYESKVSHSTCWWIIMVETRTRKNLNIRSGYILTPNDHKNHNCCNVKPEILHLPTLF